MWKNDSCTVVPIISNQRTSWRFCFKNSYADPADEKLSPVDAVEKERINPTRESETFIEKRHLWHRLSTMLSWKHLSLYLIFNEYIKKLSSVCLAPCQTCYYGNLYLFVLSHYHKTFVVLFNVYQIPHWHGNLYILVSACYHTCCHDKFVVLSYRTPYCPLGYIICCHRNICRCLLLSHTAMATFICECLRRRFYDTFSNESRHAGRVTNMSPSSSAAILVRIPGI